MPFSSICGICPGILVPNATLFAQVVGDHVSQSKEEEVLVIPMPQGDVKTMEHILAFFGSECSSEEAKNHCWPLPLGDLREKQGSDLFHPSVLRWLRCIQSVESLVNVLALAHYINAEFLTEIVAAFLAKEILAFVGKDPLTSLLSSVQDPFEHLSFHVRQCIAKRLSPLLYRFDLDIHFPSMFDALAVCPEVWHCGPNLLHEDSGLWGDDHTSQFTRFLRRRCRLLQGCRDTSSLPIEINKICGAQRNWDWLATH